MICFSRCRTKSSKLRKSSCHQIMPLSKNQRNNLKKFWTKQKHYIQDFWIVPSFMFLITKKIVLEGFLSELKQKILYEPKESNCIKHQKKKLFPKKIISFFLIKKISVGNCLQKLFIPFSWNIKNIPSAHLSSTLYLKLSNIRLPCSQSEINYDKSKVQCGKNVFSGETWGLRMLEGQCEHPRDLLREQFFLPALGICHSCSDFQNHEA